MTPGVPDDRAPRVPSRTRQKADPEARGSDAVAPVGNAATARRKPAQARKPQPRTPRQPTAKQLAAPRAAAAAAARSTVADESGASPAASDAEPMPTPESEAPAAPKPRAPRKRKPVGGPSRSRSATTAASTRAAAAPAASARPAAATTSRAPARTAAAAAATAALRDPLEQETPLELVDPLPDAPAEVDPEQVTAEPAESEPIESGLLEAALSGPAPDQLAPPSRLPDLKLVPALEMQTPQVREAARPVRTVRSKPRPVAPPDTAEVAVEIIGLTKRYGLTAAVESIDLQVRAGSFYGLVGPNGAGKTTTLSMLTGLVRPGAGRIVVDGIDVWAQPKRAKQAMGVLPDRLRLFDRLTGAQLLDYAGSLRGLDRATRRRRAADLASAFELTASLDRFVSDYSAGMTKKIALAAAMIHSPRVLVLDEPFESVDPVSSAVIVGILQRFTAVGGTVIMSSHSMELVERVCDSVAVIVDGGVLASGPLVDVLDGASLEERFVELAGGTRAVEGMEWLQSFSD